MLLVISHAWVVHRQAAFASAVGREGLQIDLPYRLIRPEFTVDGHMWIRYAVRLQQGEGPQLRHSQIDNAPYGREVHWNSGYAWWIAAWGWVWQKATGLPVTQATERAAMWLNAPLLIGFTLLFSIWATRRWGWKVGITVGTCMVIMPNLYEGFWPGYADHHGLIAASLMGLMLGAAMMRGGWVESGDATAPAKALAAARCSAIWGAVGLWISAASAIPAIALVVASALIASWLARRDLTSNSTFSPAVWRAWGVTGALTSLAFYVLEYFPFHFGWRLEVNHPLYALAWLAGAELAARAMPLLASPADRGAWRGLVTTAVWALPAALAPAVIVVIWKAEVFLPIDPFMAGLHRSIIEFLPELSRLKIDGWLAHSNTLIFSPTVYLIGLAFLLVRGADRWALAFGLGLALPMHALGFYQSRWAMSATPGQVLVIVALLLGLPRVTWFAARRGWRIALVTLVLALSWGLGVFVRFNQFRILSQPIAISPSDARQIIYREVAQMIRQSQPEGEIIFLSGPNASVNVAFFGDFKTLGTLYWENLAGLRAAAEIIAAPSAEEAARLIQARGVTHLALFRDGNYILEYAALLRPGISLADAQKVFGFSLLDGRQVPLWLEAVPYAAPTDLPKEVDREVLVFKVNFSQNSAGAAYNLAILQLSRQEFDDALKSLAQALEFDPSYYPAALRRGEYFVSQEKWDQAEESFDLAIKIAPVWERYRLLTQVGIGFGSKNQLARAVAYYERALREKVTNNAAANNLAWILATAPEEKLRNPKRALELAQQCAAQFPDSPPAVGTLAAALAADGQFSEAAANLERAIQLARAQGMQPLLPQMEERLAAYRANKLWVAP
jgi:tetratricopeptide (TPR) repeat protein